MTSWRRFLTPAAIVLLSTLPALAPLLRSGFFVSDDGRFHVYRIAALAGAWQQGILHPRLFPEFGFGYGQAVLNFYSPAGYWPGALLAVIGISPATAAKITIALGLALAALAAYAYVRHLWGPVAGLAAAIVYTYFPYHLADAYVRGAIPELLAFIFPPLILWAYTAAVRPHTDGHGQTRTGTDAHRPPTSDLRSFDFAQDRPLTPVLWAGLAWAGLALTHHLSALMLAPVALTYVLVLAARSGRWRRLWGVAGSLALGAGLSAAYWLPAFVESGGVGLSDGPSRGYENHMLELGALVQGSLAYIYRNDEGFALVYPLSWLMALLPLCVLALALLRWRQRRSPPQTTPLSFHLALTAGTIFLISAPSLFLWRPLTSILGHLQYPWRFLVLTAVGIMVVAGALAPLLPRVRPWLLIAVLFALAALVALPLLPYQPLDLPAADAWSPQRMWAEDADMGQVGATWTGEFLPATVTEQRWALGRPRPGAVDGPALSPPPTLTLQCLHYSGLSARVDTRAAFSLRLHQFHLPGWNARIDGAVVPTYPTTELGLVTVDVPAGAHVVDVSFGHTPARMAGSLLSALAVLAFLLLAWRPAHGDRRLAAAAGLLLALALILSLNSLGLGGQMRSPEPVQAQLDDAALLVAYETRPARGAEALDVTLYWLALRETATDYVVFVHLLDGAGQVVAQHDGDPGGGFTPTTRWRPGLIVADTHRIALPPGLSPAGHSLRVGMYEFVEGGIRNLAVQPTAADNRVDLGVLP